MPSRPAPQPFPGTLANSRYFPFGVATLLIAALYGAAIPVPPVSDDWQLITWAHAHGWDLLFAGRNFRLWERLVTATGYHAFGSISAFAIAASLLAFAASAALLASCVRRLAPGIVLAPLLAVVLYVVHPANASAVIQPDTLGQTLACLFVLAAVRLVVFGDSSRSQLAAGGVIALSALLAKETAAGAIAWLPFAWALRHAVRDGGLSQRDRKALLVVAAAAAAAFATYLAIRWLAASPVQLQTTARYSIQFEPFRIAANAAQLVGCALFWGDTATLLVFGPGGFTWAAVIISLALLAITVPALRHWREALTPGTARDLVAWLSLGAASLVPAVLIGHVSELYVAGLTPFVAAFGGIALARVRFRPMALALLAAAAVSGGWGISQKLALHRQYAQAAWDVGSQLWPLLDVCGDGDPVIDADHRGTTSGGRVYSVYSATHERLMRLTVAAHRNPATAAWLGPRMRTTPAGNAACERIVPDRCEIRCRIGAVSGAPLQRCRPATQAC